MKKVKTLKQVFAYLRVSDITQVKGDGYIRQEQACREYAEAHDMEIIKVYRESVSGTKKSEDRPVLAELMVSLEQNHHGVTTVLIERLDRLARDYMIQEAIVRDFQKKEFTLISTNEAEPDLASDDPTRKLLRTFMGAIADYEKSMTIAKLRAARDRLREKNGKCEGPNGYRDTEEGRQLLLHIAELRKRNDKGKRLTLQQTADKLNEEGIKTMRGLTWNINRLGQAITPTYNRK